MWGGGASWDKASSMLCIQYVSVCLYVSVWGSGKYSSSEPWKLLHFGCSMTDVSYIRSPFLLCNCVCIVLQQKLGWRGESGRKTPEDMQASEVQWMKYSVGTALGKLTSTVLGNALGTAQGGATCFGFFFIHVVSDMLVLLALLMCFYSLCGKNVLDFMAWQDTSQVANACRCLLKLLCAHTFITSINVWIYTLISSMAFE